MQLLRTAALGAMAMASYVAAQAGVQFLSVPNTFQAGKPATITYSGGDGPATIVLRQGDPNNLKTVATLTTSATGGSYQWTPESSFPSGSDYALQISQGGSVNYSGRVAVAGGGPPSVSSSIASSAASASASASSVSSSASSKISSILSSVSTALNSTIATSTSMTTSMTGSLSGTGTHMTRNTTMVSPTLSSSSSKATTTATTTTASSSGGSGSSSSGGASATSTRAPGSPNAAAGLASPLALVLGVVAAMLYLH